MLNQVLFLNGNFVFPMHTILKSRIMVLNIESIHIQMESVYFAFKTFSLKMG